MNSCLAFSKHSCRLLPRFCSHFPPHHDKNHYQVIFHPTIVVQSSLSTISSSSSSFSFFFLKNYPCGSNKKLDHGLTWFQTKFLLMNTKCLEPPCIVPNAVTSSGSHAITPIRSGIHEKPALCTVLGLPPKIKIKFFHHLLIIKARSLHTQI